MNEIDFETINCIFSSNIEVGGEYYFLLNDCQLLIYQILENNQLDPPNTEKTDTFLHILIPNLIKSLLQLHFVSGDELEADLNFLTLATSICTWGVKQKFKELIEVLPTLLDPNQEFYKSSLSQINIPFSNLKNIEDISFMFASTNLMDLSEHPTNK